LKIKLSPDFPAEESFDLEEARQRLNFESGMILVEGQIVHSYDELVHLAAQEEYRDKEFLEVIGIMPIAGG
jgi:hypothetical protein